MTKQGEAAFDRKDYSAACTFFSQVPANRMTADVELLWAWACYYKKDYAAAESRFQKLIKRHPRSIDALSGAGWSLYQLERYPEGEAMFQKALRVAPWHASSVSGLNACRDLLSDDDDVVLVKLNRWHGRAQYYMTYSTFAGDTPKQTGLNHDLFLEMGQVGKNYLNLLATFSEIETDVGVPTFQQTEIRSSGGWVVNRLLLRGTVGFMNLDDTPEEGMIGSNEDLTAWVGSLGLEMLGRKVNGFGDFHGFFAPNVTVLQAVPGLAYQLGLIDLRSSLELGFYDPADRENERTIYFQQAALVHPTFGTSLAGGLGVGSSYYGMRSPGGVFYSLPDKRLADAWLQWSIDFDPTVLSIGAGFARFETNVGRQYESYNVMLSVGWLWDGI